MNDGDLQKIRGVIRNEVTTVVKQEIAESEQRILGTVRSEIVKSAQGLRSEIVKSAQGLRSEIVKSEERVLGEIGKFVSDELLPAIDEKADKADVDRLERKLDYYGARVSEHGYRLDTIESLPTVAHELKLKRKTKA